MEMIDILAAAVKKGASDIHIVVNKLPLARINGEIQELREFNEAISAGESKRLIHAVLSDEQKKHFDEKLELDCSIHLPGISRFRLNVLKHKNGMGAVFRSIPSEIPSPEKLLLAESIVKLAHLPRGLILVTGPTGSGKSTTLACLLDIINKTRKDHIITVEDPIEFVYESKNCIVTQREVGMHTHSFTDALKHALREDPDVVLVGEMRDLETIGAAITIAETGHLVLATLHTTDAPSSIDRIIDVFPPYQQQQIRMQLSTCLQAVISQTLVRTLDGNSRVAAREIMIVTTAISNLIREGKTHQLYQAIEVGEKAGMKSLDKSLGHLVRDGVISLDDALAKAHNPEMVKFASRYS
ncbi:MAG: Twitching mobility protein [Elusimicrobia bacterium ADurb.Bin231]|nr:MAG: Twitching mobility protein [Elusimicrobia bacterium ADurb.Bin231]